MKKVLSFLSVALGLHLSLGPRPGFASGSITNCSEEPSALP